MKYEIALNGRRYEVEVEETAPMAMDEFQTYAPAAPAVAAAPAAAAAPASAPAAVPAFNGAGECVSAPMPGTILKVNVNPGDKVTEGQVLVILEAMKMENEIMAPKAGTVTQVLVTRGSSVDTGAAMVIIG